MSRIDIEGCSDCGISLSEDEKYYNVEGDALCADCYDSEIDEMFDEDDLESLEDDDDTENEEEDW